MTSTLPISQSASGPGHVSNSKGEASKSWIPPIPSPLQHLFDSVPLVTYPPNELPYRSPTSRSLPALHVFISEKDAARGLPSFNPSCLKWQTYLHFANVTHDLVPSTNHASPTGSLPFLQPAVPSSPQHRLDARHLLPIPSSRLDSYARQHGSLPPSHSSITTTSQQQQQQQQQEEEQEQEQRQRTPDQRHHRQQAYQALLDIPIRNAWLYALYLSPTNKPLLRHLYIDPVSRAGLVRSALLRELQTAARAEVAKASETTTTTSTGWKLSGNVGDLLTWALGGKTVVDPGRVYDEAKRAFEALETLLATSSGEFSEEGGWFFGASHPTLFDASVFSYVYLILFVDENRVPWGDDTLRAIVRDACPHLVAHARRIRETYW